MQPFKLSLPESQGSSFDEDLSDSDLLTDPIHDHSDSGLENDYWVCTCGHENEATDQCGACDAFLSERFDHWQSFMV